MKILYVSAHNPLPARSGGQVDILNRLRALRTLGHRVHLFITVHALPSQPDRDALLELADRLTLVRRRPLLAAVFGRRPVQMAARDALRTLDLGEEAYDLLLLDSEFPGEILCNPTLRAERIAIRVHNDEAAYQRKLSETTRNPLVRLYCRMESRRMSRYLPALWRRADALWFISSDELTRFGGWRKEQRDTAVLGALLPAALDLGVAAKPALGNAQVLFVGSLAVTLNQDALRWYLRLVHPQLLDLPGYEFVIAGSTLGRDLAALRAELLAHPRVRVHCDVPDLAPLFDSSSVFVSPMQRGAGVKLKTVEAVLRGLPLVTTTVGAEGSGLLPDVDCRLEDSPAGFAAAVRCLIQHPELARAQRDRAAEHILAHYDHARELGSLIAGLFRSPYKAVPARQAPGAERPASTESQTLLQVAQHSGPFAQCERRQ